MSTDYQLCINDSIDLVLDSLPNLTFSCWLRNSRPTQLFGVHDLRVTLDSSLTFRKHTNYQTRPASVTINCGGSEPSDCQSTLCFHHYNSRVFLVPPRLLKLTSCWPVDVASFPLVSVLNVSLADSLSQYNHFHEVLYWVPITALIYYKILSGFQRAALQCTEISL